jgi:polysaccharide pyruvyl transferase WcaK-like protein
MQNIIITGGNFINKGAQSMLFCTVDGLTNKYPGAKIIMIDLFPSLSQNEKKKYTFSIVNMHIRTVLRIAFPILKFIVKPKPISNPEKEILQHFKTADMVLDISGYGVSSHNQKPIWTYATLFPVKLAKKYNVPFIFLPQSIGPFEFKRWKKWILWPLIKKYLGYSKTIFIREPECRSYLNTFRLDGIIDSFDLVLQSPTLNVRNIYANADEIENNEKPIPPHSVIIIPNKQLTKLSSINKVIHHFSRIIQHLIAKHENVIILRHSSDDNDLCNQIYSRIKQPNVHLINEDLSPYQIQQILKESKYVVASRYHGLIHALKLGKPSIVIGWANKYKKVMDTFNLQEYHFDIRKVSDTKMHAALEKMGNQYTQISQQISQQVQEIQTDNIFDHLT